MRTFAPMVGLSLFFASTLAAATPNQRNEQPGGKKPLKVLAIGNSYSVCTSKMLPQVAQNLGLALDLACCTIGGCSLEKHVRLVEGTTTDKNHPVKPWYFNTKYVSGDAPLRDAFYRLEDILAADRWDVITLQQASHESWKPESFHPWGEKLVEIVRKACPQAEIRVQETWADDPSSGRCKSWKITSREMYERLHRNYAEFAAQHGFKVIPTGTAIEALRTLTLPHKGFQDPHLGPWGELLQAHVWAQALFETDVRTCKWQPSEMSGLNPKMAAKLREIAYEAVEKPVGR